MKTTEHTGLPYMVINLAKLFFIGLVTDLEGLGGGLEYPSTFTNIYAVIQSF